MRKVIVSIALMLILLTPAFAGQNHAKPQPLNIQVANAVDTVAQLDLAVAKQIELDVGAGKYPDEIRETLLEAAKARYDYSNSMTQLANTLRAFPNAYEAKRGDEEFQEICIGNVRMLIAEFNILKTSKGVSSPKLLDLMLRANKARKFFIKLLLDL
jgi:hypothetical protein